MCVERYRAEATENVQALVDAGFSLIKVDYERGYGQDEGADFVTANGVKESVDAVLAVDDAHLYIKTPSGDSVWVYFVLGNSDGEVVNDWSIPADRDEAELIDNILSEIADRRMA